MKPVQRLREMTNSMHLTYAIYLGVELGLFDRLASSRHPLVLRTFVKNAPYCSDYLVSWVHAMQAAGVLRVDVKERLSFMPAWKKALTDRDASNYVGDLAKCHVAIAKIYAHYPRLYNTSKGMRWSQMGGQFVSDVMEDGARFANYFLGAWLDRIPGLRKKLAEGAVVYDVGCGGGFFVMKLARTFPRSRFVGLDTCCTAIAVARKQLRKQRRVKNIEFVNKPAACIPSGSADFIVFNEVLHEMPLAEREPSFLAMRKALKKDALLFIVDILAPETHAHYARKSAELSALVEFFETPFGSKLMSMKGLKSLLTKTGFGPMKPLESSDNVVAAYVKGNP